MTKHIYEIKLLSGKIQRGQIVQRNDKGIWIMLPDKQKIYVSYTAIMMIKDLGWQS